VVHYITKVASADSTFVEWSNFDALIQALGNPGDVKVGPPSIISAYRLVYPNLVLPCIRCAANTRAFILSNLFNVPNNQARDSSLFTIFGDGEIEGREESYLECLTKVTGCQCWTVARPWD